MTHRTARLCLATALATVLATPAWAQSSGASGDSGDIIVTARRIEEKLQDVPISIQVFSQQQLSNRNVTNAQDLAAYTPSLSTTTGFGSENSTFALRGFVQETGTAPSVGVYFGEVVAPRGPSQGFPAGDGAGPGMFFDLQNVQVLKGPQGTLFGRNTTGGAVVLVPQKPTDKHEGYFEVSVGNYNMYRLQAVANLPLGEHARLRIGTDYQKRDGFMKNVLNVGPKDYDNINYVALRASLVIDVTPDIENYTIGSYVNSDNNGHIAKLVACDPNGFFNSPFFYSGGACANIAAQNAKGFYYLHGDMPDAYQKSRQWQVINNTKWRVNDNLTVRNIVSYAQAWSKTHTSLFGTSFALAAGTLAAPIPGVFPGFPAAPVPYNFANIRHLPGGFSSNQKTFTEEFRLEGRSGDGRLNYQTGFYYENSTPRGFIGSQSQTFIGCSNPDGLVCSNFDLTGLAGMNYTAATNAFRSTGVYAQGTYALNDKLKLTGGFRYTWDRVHSVSQRITYIFPFGALNASPLLPVVSLDPANGATAAVSHCTDQSPIRTAPGCLLDESIGFSAPTWLIGLDYKPNPDTLIYAKYVRGYRTGNIKSDVPIEFHVFKPEKVDTYEIGTKLSFGGSLRGTFNVSGFYNNFRNQQIQLGYLANSCRFTGPPVFDANGQCVPNLPPVSVPGNAGPVNIGKSRIWGIEADTTLHLFEGFRIDAAYTYLNTKVLDVSNITLPTDNVYAISASIKAGDPLILSPNHKFTVTGTYTLPLDKSIGEVSLGATVTYSSDQISNYGTLRDPTILVRDGGFDTSHLGARTLLNLNLNWVGVGGSPVDLSFFATNVTNKNYYTGINGLFGLGYETATVGEPRMFGMRAKIRFGE